MLIWFSSLALTHSCTILLRSSYLLKCSLAVDGPRESVLRLRRTKFIIGTVVPQILVSIGWGIFFGVWCVFASVFSFFLVPETSNQSLKQVAADFGDNHQADWEDPRSHVQQEVWAETSVPSQIA